MEPFGHIPVLVSEVLAALRPAPGQVFVDATAGLGGHARAVARALGLGGTAVLCDVDAGNLTHAAASVRALDQSPRVLEHHGSFAGLGRVLAQLGLRADMVLADLGFASSQVDDASRGLSFMRDGPLDMRLDPSGPLTAAALVASSSEADLTRIIREFGEERHAALVSRRIIEERRRGAIVSTGQLAALVRSALGGKYPPPHAPGAIDPATRTFQGLRIAVNDELGHLEAFLDSVGDAARLAARGEATWLVAGARISMIAFHSLEDRPVKQAFRALSVEGVATETPRGHVEAGEVERGENPRSRSAKLRTLSVGGLRLR